jgi:positive regulator of sigma E activity
MSHTDSVIPDAEYGVVRAIDMQPGSWPHPDPAPRYGVEVTVPGECEKCGVQENCYATQKMVWTESDENLAAGDQVRIEMKPGTLLKATGWVYGIPLVAVLGGVLAGYLWLFSGRPEEPRVLLSALLGVGLMLATGTLLAKLNDWVGKRVRVVAHRVS